MLTLVTHWRLLLTVLQQGGVEEPLPAKVQRSILLYTTPTAKGEISKKIFYPQSDDRTESLGVRAGSTEKLEYLMTVTGCLNISWLANTQSMASFNCIRDVSHVALSLVAVEV